jgi:uncharacterized membrane protein
MDSIKVQLIQKEDDMSNLIVLAFKDEIGATMALNKLEGLQKQNLIRVDDAAIAIHPAKGKVKVHQAHSLAGAGALGGAFWGMLFGLIFFVPFIGLAVGAATGALMGKASDLGVDDDFIKEVSNAIKPGTSALFFLAENAQADKVVAEIKPLGGKVIHTSLSIKKEKELKEALAA